MSSIANQINTAAAPAAHAAIRSNVAVSASARKPPINSSPASAFGFIQDEKMRHVGSWAFIPTYSCTPIAATHAVPATMAPKTRTGPRRRPQRTIPAAIAPR
ncbi:MAG: hypothetical protein AMXMBFR81_12260 [Chthonomonas sp.]